MVFLNLHLETNLQKHEHFWDISASTVKHFLFPVVPLPEKKTKMELDRAMEKMKQKKYLKFKRHIL